MSSYEIINIGALPNDGEGDPLRVAFNKINNNFSSLFDSYINTSISYSNGDTPNQVIFEAPSDEITLGEILLYTADPETNESQSIKFSMQVSQESDEVKFTGYGTTFTGNALSTYDMTISSGNVQLLASPLKDDLLFHFVGSQTLWTGEEI